MATRSRVTAPVTVASQPSEAPAPASAPPTGFNLPRIVAKAVKPVETPAVQGTSDFKTSEAITLSGISRVPGITVEKSTIAVKSLKDSIK